MPASPIRLLAMDFPQRLAALRKERRFALQGLADKDERGPDEDLRLQFEALNQFSPEEKKFSKTLLESLTLKHDDAGRFSAV